jgi:basic amino acid/polyamine antiporter, APA family
VIVMRESRIEGYDPGFRVPLYPWAPLAGILISGWLIMEMGWLSSLASAGVVGFGIVWYYRYARPKINRSGAVHHVFERLGRYCHPGLQTEFREILKEKGLREDDPFDDIVERAYVIDVTNGKEFEEIVNRASELLARRIPLEPENIAGRLIDTGRYGGAPISQGMALLHFRSAAVKRSEMAIARSRGGVCVFLPPDDPSQPQVNSCNVFGIIILVSPEKNAAQHLRILAELAAQAENPSFIDALQRIENPRKLKEIIMRDSRFLELFLSAEDATRPLVGRQIREIDTPSGAFLAMLRRRGESFEPVGETELKDGDHVTFIGEPAAIEHLYRRYVDPGKDE